MQIRLVALLPLLLLAACAGQATRIETDAPQAAAVSDPGPPAALVTESFVTTLSPVDNIDSIATWVSPSGTIWLIATAKDSGRLIVFDGDTGATLQSIGTVGDAPGQFARPNGIAIFGDLAFVVERDNHRVQALRLPDFEPAGMFGHDELLKPYGIWLREEAPQELLLDITDSYQAADNRLPALNQLDHRIKRFRVTLGDDGVETAAQILHFGDTSEAGAVRWIESIVGDPLHDRLLIPEEYLDLEPGEIRIYDLQGRYLDADIGTGLFGGQPEGLALYDCADGSGYWIATDQQNDSNRFHVFDRETLQHLGTFRGETVQFTDGVALHATSTARFPAGVFYAVHQDQGVVAFDWRGIAQALDLKASCEE
jgi:3-phytase